MSLPDRLPLTGADSFLRAFDWQTRRYTGASHLAQVSLRLAPGFELDAFRGALESVARACPIVRAPIRRGLGAAVYRLDLAERAPLPPVTVHAPSAEDIPPVFFDRLNSTFAIRRGELLHVCLLYTSPSPRDPE